MKLPDNKIYRFLSSNTFSQLSLAFICLVFSCPKIDPAISPGLDASYFWAFNYFFQHNIQIGKEILFTYGPFGFLLAPETVGNNLELGYVFRGILYFLFAFYFLRLGYIINKKNWLLNFCIIFFLSIYLGADLKFIALVLLLLLHFRETHKISFLILAVLLSGFGLLIKANIIALIVIILFSFCVHEILLEKKVRSTILLFTGTIISVSVYWLLLYKNFDGFGDYFYGMMESMKGNSSAGVYHSYNNWWVVLACFASYFSIPFFIRDKRIHFFYFLTFLSVYANWKYSIGRQENLHIKVMLDYFVLCCGFIVFLSAQNIKPLHIIIIAFVFIGYYKNAEMTRQYEVDDRVRLWGINNFYDVVFKFDSYRKQSIKQSEENLKSSILPNDFLEKIGTNSVHCLPWELSYIPANHLNWKPSPVLQDYIAYRPWLDKKNADFYKSENSPRFLIWEICKGFGGALNDFEGRYLLANSPFTFHEILSHYSLVLKNENLLLLEKTKENKFEQKASVKKQIIKWNEWTDVPSDENSILSVKLDFSYSVLGFLKKNLFRDEIFWMESKLDNGKIIKYRLMIENAESGIWVTPLIEQFYPEMISHTVKSIRFSCTDERMINDNIELEFEKTEVKNKAVF